VNSNHWQARSVVRHVLSCSRNGPQSRLLLLLLLVVLLVVLLLLISAASSCGNAHDVGRHCHQWKRPWG